jgi:hypothetical protein
MKNLAYALLYVTSELTDYTRHSGMRAIGLSRNGVPNHG